MGAETSIAWTDHTFNPWWGCVKVSPGCAHCYADTFAKRVGQKVWGADAPRRFFGDKHWNEPLKWDASAKAAGVRRRVFCASMADVFEDRDDLVEPRARLFSLIQETQALDWQLLTKRPENIDRLLTSWTLEHIEGPLTNVWLGTTVEDQARADERIPHLLAVPAAVRFLSVEPLLGPVDLLPYIAAYDANANGAGEPGAYYPLPPSARGIDWVIVGGESGPGARQCDPAWIAGIVDQCREAGVPVFVKQLGAKVLNGSHSIEGGRSSWTADFPKPRDPKGGDPAEWPADLRVREFPNLEPKS